MIAFTMMTPLRPWTTNSERKGHWSSRAKLTKAWRDYFHMIGKDRPRLAWAHITVTPFQARGVLQDTGACHPAVKAAVDGMVDAGILENDTAEFLRSLTFLPTRRGEDGLHILVEGEER